jgi:hypothetical protein
VVIKIVVYVPADYVSQVKQALFAAGAGRIGAYDHCCWQTEGVGQFRPSSAALPFIGKAGTVEEVVEYKIELVCEASVARAAVAAMIAAHPYEEPAYQLFHALTLDDLAREG